MYGVSVLPCDLAIGIHLFMVISKGCFGLVLALLVFFPCLLFTFLLKSEHLVVLLHLLHHLVLLLSCFVFKHSTHAGDCLGLHSIHLVILFFLGLILIFLTDLLVSPIFLVLSVTLHPLVVHYIVRFELTECSWKVHENSNGMELQSHLNHSRRM